MYANWRRAVSGEGEIARIEGVVEMICGTAMKFGVLVSEASSPRKCSGYWSW